MNMAIMYCFEHFNNGFYRASRRVRGKRGL